LEKHESSCNVLCRDFFRDLTESETLIIFSADGGGGQSFQSTLKDGAAGGESLGAIAYIRRVVESSAG
jgi:hypothetical protein